VKLYVKFDDNLVFDVLAQKMIDPGMIRLGRSARIIPFAEHISIRKLKPREKLCHRAGDRWISSRRISFAYLMAYYMVKNKKSVLAGFFDRGDGKHVFMEIKAGNMTIETRYMPNVDSSPGNFMAMAGRQYDGIFGDASLSSEPDFITIPYERLLKEVTTGVTVFQAAVVLLIVTALTGAFLYYTGTFPKKTVVPHPHAKVKQGIPPLTGEEIRALSILITSEALVKYKLYVETLPEDIALKSASFRLLPIASPSQGQGGKQELKGTLSFQFESFYPFRGSRKSGDLFAFEKELVFTKSRSDVPAALNTEGRARQNTRGFETLVDLCDVEARGDKEWKFALAEKEYKNVVRILNDIYLSPVVINSMTVSGDKTVGELTCHRF